YRSQRREGDSGGRGLVRPSVGIVARHVARAIVAVCASTAIADDPVDTPALLDFPAPPRSTDASLPVVASTIGSAPAADAPIGPATMQDFLDGFFAAAMDSLHVPGAVFVYVADGRVVFKKGYGYANLASRTPVDPDKTLFEIASVSKLFTATALMQLYEQGKLRLDDDVNGYLSAFN